MRARGLIRARWRPTNLALPRKILRRLIPDRSELSRDRALRGVFGMLLANADLWHLNRHSVAWGLSVGLFVAYVPIPFQMLLAAGISILIGCNLPVAVVAVWVSNPITMPPMFFAAYKLGALLLGIPPAPFRFEMSVHWLLRGLSESWAPLLLGCAVLGGLLALIGQIAVRVIWRIHVANSWRSRRQRRPPGSTRPR